MKNILITGGTRGIGRACVESFLRQNKDKSTLGLPLDNIVFTWSKNEGKANEIVEKWSESPVQHFQLNLSETNSIEDKVREQSDRIGGFDVVVHNAGQCQDSNFYFMDKRQWTEVIDISLNSFFHINKVALKSMIEKRWGRIISMVSIAGEAGNRGQANYAAAKGAIISASKSLAREVSRKGILVNCVSPGIIKTDMTSGLDADRLLPMIPQGRFGEPNEVAEVVTFLSSDKASYINGTVIQVNGGMLT